MFSRSGSTRRRQAAALPTGRAAPGFRGNPYLFLGSRPFREARLRSYVVTQHQAGRPLATSLGDARTIEALERDICTAESCFPPW